MNKKGIQTIQNNLAVSLLRVSTTKQVDGYSQDLQEQKNVEWAALHGLKIVQTIRIAETAKSARLRKKYISARESALRQGIKHFLFYMPDREARNVSDIEANLELVRAGIINIHYVREGRILSENSPDSDFFFREMQGVHDSHFSRNLSRKVRDANTRKAELGWFPYNHVPLGYAHFRRKDEFGIKLKRGTTIGVHPSQEYVQLVQKEFELRATGLSLEAIRDRCLELEIVPKEKRRSYHKSTIERRLKNKFYYGKFDVRGIEYQGKHELIIPRNHLDAVASSFGKRPIYGRTHKGDNGLFAGGFLRCADPLCGCQISYDPKVKTIKSEGMQRKYHYYRCSNAKRIHPSHTYVKEEHIWSELEKVVDSICITEILAKQISDAPNKTHAKAEEQSKEVIQQCQNQIKLIDGKKDSLIELLLNKTLSDAEFKSAKMKLDDERRIAFTTLEAAQSGINGKYRETAKTIFELAIRAKELWKSRNPEERLQFVKMILSNQQLDGKTLRYEMKKPFSVLAKMASDEKWRFPIGTRRTFLYPNQLRNLGPIPTTQSAIQQGVDKSYGW